MKKTVLLFLFILSCHTIKAQMTRWIMQPVYDKIYMVQGAPIIVSEQSNQSTLWNINGEKIAETKDILHAYKEGLSVTTKKGSNSISGFYNTNGKFVQIKNGSTTYDYPYFSDGHLLAQSENIYFFINTKGEEKLYGRYVKIYPYSNGIASCFTYESIEKQKNPYYVWINTNSDPIELWINDKAVDNEDVEFLSSISNDGTGIAIIKHKVYYFNKRTNELSPVYAKKGETNPKKQVSVDKNIYEYFVDMDDSIMIKGQSGKTENVLFYFDKRLNPKRIVFADRTEVFKKDTIEKQELKSPITYFKSTEGKFGLKYYDKEILPAQFEEIGFRINNFATVKSNGKWGMLNYDKNLRYRLIMHDGKDIAFRHKDVRTTIKLELPSIISADKCRFDVNPKYGCTIDKISLETKNTENGNYVQYKCILTIPDSLPDVVTEIQYPVQITYDDLKYPIVPIKTHAWHYKYINVDLDDSETLLEQGNVSFTINISADKQQGENDYPFEVNIATDSLQTELIKISETRYKCKLYSLKEGINNVNINILENGCPPSIFPFEITYIKPVQKTRNKPAVKETVKIQKKENVKKAQKETPILPI